MRHAIASFLTWLAYRISFPGAYNRAEHEDYRKFGRPTRYELPSRENRVVTDPDPEGVWIEAQLTDEGVIVDAYGPDNEPLDTFARTYDEIVTRAYRDAAN